MKVYMVGKTQAHLFFPSTDDPGYTMPGKAGGSNFQDRYQVIPGKQHNRDKPYTGEALIEFAGRLCYESFDLPNEATATKAGYLANILAQGHESVLEHVSVTFYVEGVSRNLSHELIRHRHLSFSELSQRFVNMEDSDRVIPPAFRNAAEVVEMDEYYKEDYLNAVAIGEGMGLKRKQAREAARFYLPQATETKFVVTGNLRAWRDVLKKRDSVHADAEMQLFAKEIKRQLLKEYPDVFKDLDEDRNDGETA